MRRFVARFLFSAATARLCRWGERCKIGTSSRFPETPTISLGVLQPWPCPHQGSFPLESRLPWSRAPLTRHHLLHCCSKSAKHTEECRASNWRSRKPCAYSGWHPRYAPRCSGRSSWRTFCPAPAMAYSCGRPPMWRTTAPWRLRRRGKGDGCVTGSC